MRRLATVALGFAVFAASCSRSSGGPIVVGAVYPLSGSQALGGVDEYRGVLLAADLVNKDGGVNGRRIEVRSIDVPGSDAAAAAIDLLAGQGVQLVVGSHGSTISVPAAAEAARKGMLFWETGAVGSMPGRSAGPMFFRVAPSGAVLGRAAVSFIAGQLAPLLHRPASSLRFAVANVDDVYGSAVADGAVAEIHALSLPFAGRFPYDPQKPDVAALVPRIAAARPDVLFVSAYLEDGIALRREMVRQHLHLVASIGTSSSYCMPMFGAALGQAAVGLFASDKPDGDAIDESGLLPDARALLDQARAAYHARYGHDMSAPALAGFSAGWALFHDVMPRAAGVSASAVADAARAMVVPTGGLPNGSGLQFAAASSDAGSNLRAVSVIWEWIGLDQRVVVWPPRFATEPIRALSIEP